MNKENQEQPENIEDPKQQETPEVDAKAEETSDQAQPADEQKPEEQVNEAQESSPKAPETEIPEAKAPEAKEAKGSDPKTTVPAAEVVENIEKVISINRITKVTKGGKKLSFSALVVVGDTQGNVGYSLSKAAEVSIAIRKAMATAKKNMIKIPMKGTTIPHEIIGKCGGSRVLLKPASDGTGVIASGPVRAVCDGAGIHNILTKCHRSNNPINVVKATIDGLTRLKTVEPVNE
ncbi:MAG: 30S ribosomal protein S5 [Candidatus Omnitrophica bacterium]|nr:30S ribosomal protein S5 [Candidatus Omnitrophota bacterium]